MYWFGMQPCSNGSHCFGLASPFGTDAVYCLGLTLGADGSRCLFVQSSFGPGAVHWLGLRLVLIGTSVSNMLLCQLAPRKKDPRKESLVEETRGIRCTYKWS